MFVGRKSRHLTNPARISTIDDVVSQLAEDSNATDVQEEHENIVLPQENEEQVDNSRQIDPITINYEGIKYRKYIYMHIK